MKKQTIIIGVILTILISACAPAEPVSEVAEPQVMEEQAEEVMESSESEVMEESDTEEEAMEADSETAEVSFSADVWPIIEQYALNAHGGKGGIFLESYDDIVAQVVPGDPENSMLYKVLIGDGAPQMPPGNPLPEELIQTIYDWIDQGAKNN